MKTPEKSSLFLRDKDLIRIKEILKSYVPKYVILAYGSRVDGRRTSRYLNFSGFKRSLPKFKYSDFGRYQRLGKNSRLL